MQTAFRKWGNSQGIIIPKPMLELAGIEENASVDISVENGAIVIHRIEKREQLSIKKFFEGYAGDYKGEEIDWGAPVGDEIW